MMHANLEMAPPPFGMDLDVDRASARAASHHRCRTMQGAPDPFNPGPHSGLYSNPCRFSALPALVALEPAKWLVTK